MESRGTAWVLKRKGARPKKSSYARLFNALRIDQRKAASGQIYKGKIVDGIMYLYLHSSVIF
jgi:hypothetical protein